MDRDFVFGVLAVQLGFASPLQVMTAAAGRLVDDSRSIAGQLLTEGVLDDVQSKLLEGMVDQAIKNHGDVRRTMQSLGGFARIRRASGSGQAPPG